MLSLKIGQDYLCYSFFVPPQDFEFQPPTRVMRTRAEVHADAGGNGVGMLSGNRHRWSPCIPWPPPADRGCGYFRISPSPPHSTNTNPRFLNKSRGFVVSGVLKYRVGHRALCPAPSASPTFYNHPAHIIIQIPQVLNAPSVRWQLYTVFLQGPGNQVAVWAKDNRRHNNAWVVI